MVVKYYEHNNRLYSTDEILELFKSFTYLSGTKNVTLGYLPVKDEYCIHRDDEEFIFSRKGS